MNNEKQMLICHLIGQYNDISDGGGVAPFMLAHWLDMSRQGVSYWLRQMTRDGILKRVGYDYREGITAYRYFLTEETQDKYEFKQFQGAYHRYVMQSNLGTFFYAMTVNNTGKVNQHGETNS